MKTTRLCLRRIHRLPRSGLIAGAWTLAWLTIGPALARAQDAVEVKTNRVDPGPVNSDQVRLSATADSDGGAADNAELNAFVPLDMNANKITNLAAGTSAADAVRFDQIGSLNGPFVRLAAGAADTYTNSNSAIWINENGAGTPSLLQLQSGGVDRFVVGNSGIVTTGTWNATVIAETYGGTGENAVSTGDLLYGAGANNWSRLAGPAAAGNFLRSSAANTFGWNTIQASDINTMAFVQNGNSFGATAVLGTNDAFNLTFETSGTTRMTLDTSGNLSITGDLTVTGGNINVTSALYQVATGTTSPVGGRDLTASGSVLTGAFLEAGGALESGGVWANGDVLVLWSPGDQGILQVYEEDAWERKLYMENGGGLVLDDGAVNQGTARMWADADGYQFGAYAANSTATSWYVGVRGLQTSTAAVNQLFGVHGTSGGNTQYSAGVYGYGESASTVGVIGIGGALAAMNTRAGSGGSFAGSGTGVYARAEGANPTNYGIYAEATGGTTNWDGYFTGSGRVRVTDSITISGTSTRFGMAHVSRTSGDGTLFTHPVGDLRLYWDDLGTTGNLWVYNDAGGVAWYDIQLYRTSEGGGGGAFYAINDVGDGGGLGIAGATSAANGFDVNAVAEDATGPGFTFSGSGYSDGVQGLVIYWWN